MILKRRPAADVAFHPTGIEYIRDAPQGYRIGNFNVYTIVIPAYQIIFAASEMMQRQKVDFSATVILDESCDFPYMFLRLVEPWNQRHAEDQADSIL